VVGAFDEHEARAVRRHQARAAGKRGAAAVGCATPTGPDEGSQLGLEQDLP
jgi:hypothetical protein